MLAPRISLKQLLLGMVGVAFFLALVSLAYNGSMVAFGLSVSILAIPVLFLAYAIVYGTFSLLLVLGPNPQTDKGSSVESIPMSSESTGD